MAKAFYESFNTVEELEIRRIEELASVPNFDKVTTRVVGIAFRKEEELLPVQKFEPVLFECMPCRKFLVLE